MTYFTVLWITILSGPLEGSTSGLIYTSKESCIAAIPAVAKTIEGQYDFAVLCEETSRPSASPRPLTRPEDLTDE